MFIYHWAIFKVHLTELQIKPLQVQSVLILPRAPDLGDFWWLLLPIKIGNFYFWVRSFYSQTVPWIWIYFQSLSFQALQPLPSWCQSAEPPCSAGLVQELSYAFRQFPFLMFWFSFAFSHLSGAVSAYQSMKAWVILGDSSFVTDFFFLLFSRGNMM